jgi:hypothetical protein
LPKKKINEKYGFQLEMISLLLGPIDKNKSVCFLVSDKYNSIKNMSLYDKNGNSILREQQNKNGRTSIIADEPIEIGCNPSRKRNCYLFKMCCFRY